MVFYLFVIYKANIEVYGILFPIVDLSYAKASHNEIYTQKLRTMKVWAIFIIPPRPKTLPTIWYTYMMLVTKYQISAINSYWEKCNEKYLWRTEGWKDGRTDGQTDRGKTVYPPPPSGSGGIIKIAQTFMVLNFCV
jgi:hypothetical protein